MMWQGSFKDEINKLAFSTKLIRKRFAAKTRRLLQAKEKALTKQKQLNKARALRDYVAPVKKVEPVVQPMKGRKLFAPEITAKGIRRFDGGKVPVAPNYDYVVGNKYYGER